MAYIGNPDYTVTIQSFNTDGPPIIVRAPLGEDFIYDIRADYEAPFAQGLTGNPMIDTLLRLAGTRFVTQGLTAQFWQGSSSTELSLELQFVAESDPISEVRDPIVALLKLCTPGVDGKGMITSPGPQIEAKVAGAVGQGLLNILTDVKNTITAAMTDPSKITLGPDNSPNSNKGNAPLSKNSLAQNIKNQVSVRIGSFAFFDSVVITDVQKTYSSVIDAATGLPMHAKVTLQFRPLFMIVQSDLDNIFPTSRMNLNGGNFLGQSLGQRFGSNGSVNASIDNLNATLSPASGNTWSSSYPINSGNSNSSTNDWANAPQPMKGSF